MSDQEDLAIEILDCLFSLEASDFTIDLLDNGFPAYIKKPDMPKSVLIKLHPQGNQELVYIDKNYDEIVICSLK